MDEFLSAYIYCAKSLHATFDNASEEYKNGLILARDRKRFIEAKDYREEVSMGPIFISSLGPCFDTIDGKVSVDLLTGSTSPTPRHIVSLAFLRIAPCLENNPSAFIFIYESLKESGIIPPNLNILLQESYGHTVSFRFRGPKPWHIVWPLHSLIQGGHRLMILASDALKIRVYRESIVRGLVDQSSPLKEINETSVTTNFISHLIDVVGNSSKRGGYAVVSPQSLIMLADGSLASCCMRGITEDSFLFSRLSSLDQRLMRILKFNREEVYRELERRTKNEPDFLESITYRTKRFDDTFLSGRFTGTSNVQDHRNRTLDNYHRICRNFVMSSMLSIFTLINKDLYHLLDATVRGRLNSYFFSPLYLNEVCLGKNMSNVFAFLKNMATLRSEEKMDCGKSLISLIEELSEDVAETEENRKNIIETMTSDTTEEDIQIIPEDVTDIQRVSEMLDKTRELKRKGIRNLVKYYVENSIKVFAQICKIPHQPKISLQENASSTINNAFFRIMFFASDVTLQERATVVKNMCDFLSLVLAIYFFVDIPTALLERNASIFQRDITDHDVTFFKNLMETTKRKLPKCLLNMHFLNPNRGTRCHNHFSCNLVKHFTWVKEHGTGFFDRYIKPIFTSSCEMDCLGREMVQVYLKKNEPSLIHFDENFSQCEHASKLMGSIKRFLHIDTYNSVIEGDTKTIERFFESELNSLNREKIIQPREDNKRKDSSSLKGEEENQVFSDNNKKHKDVEQENGKEEEGGGTAQFVNLWSNI